MPKTSFAPLQSERMENHEYWLNLRSYNSSIFAVLENYITCHWKDKQVKDLDYCARKTDDWLSELSKYFSAQI